MTTETLTNFYVASASVAGALIGLLFVAVSVNRGGDRDRRSPAQNIRAGASMTAFTNALAVSLFTLIEGPRSGAPALVVAVIGLLFVVASVISLRHRPRMARDVLFLVTLVGALIAQLVSAIAVSGGHGNLGDERQAAAVVVVFFLIGIARAWELIDGPSIGLRSEVLSVAREKLNHAEARPVEGDSVKVPAR